MKELKSAFSLSHQGERKPGRQFVRMSILVCWPSTLKTHDLFRPVSRITPLSGNGIFADRRWLIHDDGLVRPELRGEHEKRHQQEGKIDSLGHIQ